MKQNADVASEGWTTEYDETTGDYFFFNQETGESKWAEYTEEHSVASTYTTEQSTLSPMVQDVHVESFIQCETEDGEKYYVPADGHGETVWDLPDGAVVVEEPFLAVVDPGAQKFCVRFCVRYTFTLEGTG